MSFPTSTEIGTPVRARLIERLNQRALVPAHPQGSAVRFPAVCVRLKFVALDLPFHDQPSDERDE